MNDPTITEHSIVKRKIPYIISLFATIVPITLFWLTESMQYNNVPISIQIFFIIASFMLSYIVLLFIGILPDKIKYYVLDIKTNIPVSYNSFIYELRQFKPKFVAMVILFAMCANSYSVILYLENRTIQQQFFSIYLIIILSTFVLSIVFMYYLITKTNNDNTLLPSKHYL